MKKKAKRVVTLKSILSEHKIDGRVARRKLRRVFKRDHKAHGTKWEFKKGSDDHKKALKTLGV